MGSWTQLALQDSTTSTINLLLSFHDLIIIIIVTVLRTISYIIFFLISNKFSNRTLKEAHKTELIWTIIPASILIMLALPSLHLLYLIDELNKPTTTIKAIGHQWYWRYEYTDLPHSVLYDSFMVPTSLLKKGEFRLLEVDNRIAVPTQKEVRLLVTATDVIHAWTVPTIGVKADAIPGRLNQLRFTLNRSGVFYGQCSEICGANHSFMPIVIESVNTSSFIKWLKNK